MCLQEQTHAPSPLCRFLAYFFLAHEGAPPPAAEARERSRETDCHVASLLAMTWGNRSPGADHRPHLSLRGPAGAVAISGKYRSSDISRPFLP